MSDCDASWLDDGDREHWCSEDAEHGSWGGPHRCGCGAAVPVRILEQARSAEELRNEVARLQQLYETAAALKDVPER
jgi:hypothetical protein